MPQSFRRQSRTVIRSLWPQVRLRTHGEVAVHPHPDLRRTWRWCGKCSPAARINQHVRLLAKADCQSTRYVRCYTHTRDDCRTVCSHHYGDNPSHQLHATSIWLYHACTTVPAALADCCEDWTHVLTGFIACVCYTGSWSNHHLTCHRTAHPLAVMLTICGVQPLPETIWGSSCKLRITGTTRFKQH